MRDGFVQIPADGNGKKLRHFVQSMGGEDRYSQGTVEVDANGTAPGLANAVSLTSVRYVGGRYGYLLAANPQRVGAFVHNRTDGYVFITLGRHNDDYGWAGGLDDGQFGVGLGMWPEEYSYRLSPGAHLFLDRLMNWKGEVSLAFGVDTEAPTTGGVVAGEFMAVEEFDLYADAVMADDPVVWLRLDEASGAVATDSSGNGHHFSYVNIAGYDDGSFGDTALASGATTSGGGVRFGLGTSQQGVTHTAFYEGAGVPATASTLITNLTDVAGVSLGVVSGDYFLVGLQLEGVLPFWNATADVVAVTLGSMISGLNTRYRIGNPAWSSYGATLESDGTITFMSVPGLSYAIADLKLEAYTNSGMGTPRATFNAYAACSGADVTVPGTISCIEAPNSTLGSFDGPNQEWTAEAWIKTGPSLTWYQGTIFGKTDDAEHEGWFFDGSCYGATFTNNYSPFAEGYPWLGNPLQTSDRLAHVAFVAKTGERLRLYVNGHEFPHPSWAGIVPELVANTNKLRLGHPNRLRGGPPQYSQFAGVMKDFALYDKALTRSQIMAHYRAGRDGKVPVEQV